MDPTYHLRGIELPVQTEEECLFWTAYSALAHSRRTKKRWSQGRRLSVDRVGEMAWAKATIHSWLVFGEVE